MTFKGGETIRGANLRVGIISYPFLDTRFIGVRLMSRESLLEAREERIRKKEGFYKYDNDVKGIPLKVGCSLTPESLLQVYFVLTSQISHGIYLLQAAFVQSLLST